MEERISLIVSVVLVMAGMAVASRRVSRCALMSGPP